MKKTLVPLIAAIIMLAWAGPATAAGKREVIYAFDNAFPPFTYVEDGQPKGFEIDVLQQALEGSGFNLIMRPGSWDEIQRQLKAGNIQLSSGAAKTPQREKDLLFPDRPTCELDVRIFTAASSKIRTIADLDGRTVATQRGSLYHQLLTKMTKANLLLFDNEPQALQALNDGRADACVIAGRAGHFFIKNRDYKNISAVGTPLQVINIYYLIARNRPDLARAISQGLTAIQQDGRFERIYRRWFVPKLEEKEIKSLIEAATKASRMAYAPYSKFQVGAAVLSGAGVVHTGVNVENALYNLTATALTTAVLKAVSAGDTDIKAVVNVLPGGALAAPSAADRQLIYEFNRGAQVVMHGPDGKIIQPTVAELIPYPFDMR